MGAIEAELAALRITVNGLLETTASLSVRLAAAERNIGVEVGEIVYSRPAEYRTPTFVKAKVTRDDVIERAKADVAKLTANHRRMTTGLVSYDYEFIVNRDKRTVVALLKGSTSKRVYYRGKSRCAPGDVFNVHIGKSLSLRRALGLEVPDEYVNSPAPTEFRVGDIVWCTDKYPRVLVTKDTINCFANPPVISIALVNSTTGNRVVDDSREEVSV